MAFRLIYLVLLIVMQFCYHDRHDFPLFMVLYALLFAAYIVLVWKGRASKGDMIWLALYASVFFFQAPVLSDDIYRFIWDGQLIVNGENPYIFLPKSRPDLDFAGVLAKMNSAQYFSVYPPLNQLCFALAAFIAGTDVRINIFVLRIILFLAFLLSAALLRFYLKESGKGFQHFALFAFNPLMLIESVGNLHFEIVMLAFCLAAYGLFKWKANRFWAAVLLAFAISIKLLPLIFLPLILRHLGFKKGAYFVALVFGVNVLLFLPFADRGFLLHILSSIQLYFQTFEFNASLYYLFREAGHFLFGFNVISFLGPILGILNLAVILILSWRVGKFEMAAFFILCSYLLFSTTVHPWYLVPLLGLSAFTRFRFPFVWSFFITFSYAAYQSEPVHERLSLVFLEYLVVISFAIYEIVNYRKGGAESGAEAGF
ncbi:glycosyltransferase 87 family protein [Marinilongibacter aquaticus]|uniref:glycosyltransferase 87 family protein n=1 Tax=Marinilongibacter aquaticus TaxID=2975157 RepID=UPI0021BD2176|nr:glycosyltransferase 87 family protein [Marinilongibacter aquaticus]UBM57619.1 glycosyltransferase 87 family protein [Marinilongibacter aquaticus]